MWQGELLPEQRGPLKEIDRLEGGVPMPKKSKKQSAAAQRLKSTPSPKRREVLIAAVITGGAAVLAAIITSVFSLLSGSGTSSTGSQVASPSRTASPSSVQTDFNRALAEMESGRVGTVDNGVADLGIVYYMASPVLQRKIISILVQYIAAYAPPMPIAASSFGYCLMNPPPNYPSGPADALKIIGSRGIGGISQKINLSNINLAYATLDGLNLQNVNFDNDLLCRVISYGSNFEGASFEGADLRFMIIKDAKGLTAGQLRTAYSLYKAELPGALAADKLIEDLIRKDPALAPGFGL